MDCPKSHHHHWTIDKYLYNYFVSLLLPYSYRAGKSDALTTVTFVVAQERCNWESRSLYIKAECSHSCLLTVFILSRFHELNKSFPFVWLLLIRNSKKGGFEMAWPRAQGVVPDACDPAKEAETERSWVGSKCHFIASLRQAWPDHLFHTCLFFSFNSCFIIQTWFLQSVNIFLVSYFLKTVFYSKTDAGGWLQTP